MKTVLISVRSSDKSGSGRFISGTLEELRLPAPISPIVKFVTVLATDVSGVDSAITELVESTGAVASVELADEAVASVELADEVAASVELADEAEVSSTDCNNLKFEGAAGCLK